MITSITNFIKPLQKHVIYGYAYICIYMCIETKMGCETVYKFPVVLSEDGGSNWM